MSVFFTLNSSQPIIQAPSTALAINGETIFISGEQFNKNIIKISGQDIYNSSSKFIFNGIFDQNISGINNTLSKDTVGFTLSGIYPSKYKVYVYNDSNVSSNYFDLKVLAQPTISGFDNKNVLPGQYIKVSGSNFYPGANISFVDNLGNKVRPSFQETGLYRVTGADTQNYGTGYQTGNVFYLEGIKNYNKNSYAIFTVSTTGINGSLGSFNINNSGIFTVPNLSTGIEFIPRTGNGRGALINFLYEKYENTGLLEFLEFQVPYNIRKNQSGIIENIKFKDITSGTKFTDFYIAGYPNIYDFSPQTGLIESTEILLTGDNLSFAQSIKIGDILIDSYAPLGDTGILFTIPNFSSSDRITISGFYGSDKSTNILSVSYPQLTASGFTPNDVLAGTGTIVNISGKYLQRINYINLGQPNVLNKDITVNAKATLASFTLPNAYTTTSLRIFSVDFPTSGHLIKSPSSNDLLISTPRLSEANVDIRYLSGIQAAKYLDEIEIYSSSGTSGDYGNLTNSDVFFLGVTGHIDEPNAYSISGIKVSNSATGIRFKVPREVRNPQARIKIKRNLFGESYILPSNKSIDVLPTIFDVTPSNTLYNSLGYLTISGINASNANLAYFSGYSGTQNLLGYKEIKSFPLEIVSKNLIQITGVNGVGGDNTNGYSVFEAKLGGDITGSGELFLFNNYYDTGIGYEDFIITKNKNIRVSAISGFRPPNSDIFTSPGYISTPLENAFFYQIQTNSRATRFQFSATTISGVGEGEFPTGLETYLNSANQIFGQPMLGGIFYLKIRALDGERPNEGMILNLAVGYSGRSLSGPGITYRGNWGYGIGYVGSNLRRDVVKYSREGVNHWYAAYTNTDSEPQAGNPNWIPFTNEFSATATKVLLAEESNITNSLNMGQEGIPSGFIKTVNDVNVDDGSGFYIGYDNRYNSGRPKFRVGNQSNYIKFDGKGLDIVGPLSGIITTSKNIADAQNVVNSDYSVALGLNNTITANNDNVFIFGTNNTVTGARGSSIVAGKNNKITCVSRIFTDNSNIGGGAENLVLGSFCSVLGGYGNIVDATSSGLSAIANQMFTSDISGSDTTVEYLSEVFTKDVAILTSLESIEDIYRTEKISNITVGDYQMNLSPQFSGNQYVRVNNWISLLSPNLYSGSFVAEDPNYICEFKVGKTGLPAGSKKYFVPFTTNYINYSGEKDLIVLTNMIEGNENYKLINSSGLNSSGFYLNFPNTLSTGLNVNYFVGPTGFFIGTEFNLLTSLEINKNQPFLNLISGTGYRYDIPLQRKGINFLNTVNNFDHESIYISNLSGNSSDLKLALSSNIKDEYVDCLSIGYTGIINSGNIQVYQTGLSSGSGPRFISLLSNINDSGYVPFCNIVQTGNSIDNVYAFLISGKTHSGFYFETADVLKENIILNVSIYKTGQFTFDNTIINVESQSLTGFLSKDVSIPFKNNLNYYPNTLITTENINSSNIYKVYARNVSKTGLSAKLSDNLKTGEIININHISFSNTGNQVFDLKKNTLIDKDTNFSGNICVNLNNNFNYSELKVFPRVYSSNNNFINRPNIIQEKTNNSFCFKLSGFLSPSEMTGIVCEYVASDLTRDLNIARSVLSTFNYSRLGAFGFTDVGSSIILGGTGNYIKGLVSTIAGGVLNQIVGDFNLIPGGRSNKIIDLSDTSSQYPKSAFCTILGGLNNLITGNSQYSNIIGGSGNHISNLDGLNDTAGSTIVGGSSNEISGAFSTILGGENNSISGSYSHVFGRNINLTKPGSVVISDGSTGNKNINQANTMVLNFSGGLYITGNAFGTSPIVLDVTKLPTSSTSLPIGAVYLIGTALNVKTT